MPELPIAVDLADRLAQVDDALKSSGAAYAFGGAIAARLVPFMDRAIPIVSATHLTVLKTMFGRPKDWADITAMLEAGDVDTDAALAWTEELLGDDGPGHLRLTDLTAAAP